MQKFNEFISELKKYQKICEKICSPDINLGKTKIIITNKEFDYLTLFEKLKSNIKHVETLKDADYISYSLLADDFETNLYYNSQNGNSNTSELKKHYSLVFNLSNGTNNQNNNQSNTDIIPAFPKYPNVDWEIIFTSEASNYQETLNEEFPTNSIKSPKGQINKKFQSLVFIVFWLELKLDQIVPKNSGVLNLLQESLSANQELKSKLGPVGTEQINSYLAFVDRLDELNNTADHLNTTNETTKNLITEISSQTTESSELFNQVKDTKKEVDNLLKINKELSGKLSSKALSGTFEKSASSYNWGKRGKLSLIIALTAGLFIFSYDMLKHFDIDKMVLLEKTPFVLIIYSTPRLFVFLISAWVLKFLITTYNNDSKVALDFKHRQAIADVTPHFKKELEDQENQEQLVRDAFNVFLSKPQFEIHNETDNKLFLEKFSNLLTDIEIKNTFIKLRDLVVDKLQTKTDKEKTINEKE